MKKLVAIMTFSAFSMTVSAAECKRVKLFA